MKNRLNDSRRFGGIFSDTKFYTIVELSYEGQLCFLNMQLSKGEAKNQYHGDRIHLYAEGLSFGENGAKRVQPHS